MLNICLGFLFQSGYSSVCCHHQHAEVPFLCSLKGTCCHLSFRQEPSNMFAWPLVVHLMIRDAEHYCHASIASRLFRNAHGDPLHVFKNGFVFLLLSYLGCWCILKAVPHQVYDLQIFIKVSLFLLAFDLHHPSCRA